MAAEATTGLHFDIASNLEQVLDAWRLVYHSYRRIGLVGPNPHGIHTTAQAVHPDSTVVVGCVNGITVSTLSCVRDSSNGLPLDQEYGPELDELRKEGRHLTEIGLLADRREHMARTAESLFMLMHYSIDYSFRGEGTDAIIGVHPRHSRFYTRAFGFRPFGPERLYALVNDRPVILLRLEHEVLNQADPLPRGLRYLRDHPVAEDHYDSRFAFDQQSISHSPIESYLRDRYSEQSLVA